MKKFALLVVLLLAVNCYSQTWIDYKPTIELQIESEDKELVEQFRLFFEVDAILEGYLFAPNPEYSFRVFLIPSEKLVLVSGILLKRKPLECNPENLEIVAFYSTVGNRGNKLPQSAFKYLNNKVLKPELERRRKMFEP